MLPLAVYQPNMHYHNFPQKASAFVSDINMSTYIYIFLTPQNQCLLCGVCTIITTVLVCSD